MRLRAIFIGIVIVAHWVVRRVNLYRRSRRNRPRNCERLIVDGQNNHDWKSTTPLLQKALESSGRFTVDVATSPPSGQDMSGFRPKFARLRRGREQLQRQALAG